MTGKLDGSALMNLVAQKLHEAKISTAHLCHFFRCNKRVFFLGGDFFFRLKKRTVPWLENPFDFFSLIKLPHQNLVDFFLMAILVGLPECKGLVCCFMCYWCDAWTC